MHQCFRNAASRLHVASYRKATPQPPTSYLNARQCYSATPRPFRDIPGPLSIPGFGAYHSFLKKEENIENYYDFLVSLHDKFGSIVKMNLGFGRGFVIHLFDPEDARTVFSADGRHPLIVPLQETTQKYRQMRNMNLGLGNLNGCEWYRLRSAVQQNMMRPQSVQRYIPHADQVAVHLVDCISENINKNEQIDMSRISGRWSLESSGSVVFGKRLGALSDNTSWADFLIDLNREIFRLSAKLKFSLPIYHYISTAKWKKLVDLEDIFYNEANTLINETIAKLQCGGELEPKTMFASDLINKRELSTSDVKVILLSLFSDGLSTTAPMLIYNLFNIAKHPDVQYRLRAEINKAIGPDTEITAEILSRLPYLRACIKETFRLFPIGTEISRISQKDLILSGYLVPVGTPIDINTNVLMRSATFYKNPLSFDPSRWLRRSEQVGHPFAFLPFGTGPRMCAGRRFAEQDLLIVITRLIQSFSISHESDSIKQIYETLLLPKGNCKFIFKKV